MKDLMRQKVAVQEQILGMLNKQIKLEAQSAAAYLAKASWCDQNGFDNSATFFYNQSNEERTHMLKLFHFVSDMGGVASVPSTDEPQSSFSSLREAFEYSLDNEISVTESIHQIVAACRKAGDFATENFMQWFVKEQIEEEFVARKAIELFDMLGDDAASLLMIDERILKISFSAEG